MPLFCTISECLKWEQVSWILETSSICSLLYHLPQFICSFQNSGQTEHLPNTKPKPLYWSSSAWSKYNETYIYLQVLLQAATMHPLRNSPSARAQTSSVLDPIPFWQDGGFQAVTMHLDVHCWFSELPWTNLMPHRSVPCLVPYTPSAGNLCSEVPKLTPCKTCCNHYHTEEPII